MCGKTRGGPGRAAEPLLCESLENIFINAQTQMLLLYSMECIAGDGQDAFGCKFIVNDADREKIALARKILLDHIGEPLTIRN